MIAIPIVEAAARYWKVPVSDIVGANRNRRLTSIRIACAHVLRHRDRMSYPRIGKLLGGRDHSTILSGLRKIDVFRATYPELGGFVDFHMAQPKYDRMGVNPEKPKARPVKAPARFRPSREDVGIILERMREKFGPCEAMTGGLQRVVMDDGRAFSVDEEGLDMTERLMVAGMVVGSQRLLSALTAARASA